MISSRPDCLLVGAAKAGTSSIYKYLFFHPDVYCPSLKEPKYLTNEIYCPMTTGPGDRDNLVNNIFNEEDYLKLYVKGSDKKIKIDASADLLYYHNTAIPKIKRLLGDPYIIISLRNPVERAFSAYLHLLRDNRESNSFEKALSLEDTRIENRYEFIWHYKRASLYYESVKAYKQNFSHVKIIFQEDLAQNTSEVLDDITRFLQISALPKKENSEYKRENESKVVKNRWVEKVLFYKYKLPFYTTLLKAAQPWKEELNKYFNNLRSQNLHRPEIKQNTKFRLQNYFRQDVEQLEEYLKIDLSHWK